MCVRALLRIGAACPCVYMRFRSTAGFPQAQQGGHGMIDFVLLIVIAICIIALGLAAILTRNLLSQDEGTPKMREVADAIRVGAEAFIKRQYSTIAVLAIVSAVVIFAMYYLTGQQAIALATAAAFIVGAACSAVAGVVAMWIAVRTNIRTAAAAQTSDGKALDFSFRGGAISGLIITSMSLLGVSLTYIALGADPHAHPVRHHRVRLRCLVRGTLRPARWRYLHESR